MVGCSSAPAGPDDDAGSDPRIDSGTTPGIDSGTTPASDSGTTTPTDGGADVYPTFERDVVPLLNRSCGSATTGCHDRAAYGPTLAGECRGWLSLVDEPMGGGGCEPRDLYRRLVELDAWQCEAFDARVRYVRPCDTEGSYLLRKIAGGPYCRTAEGPTQPMPMGATLPASDIALIETWILAGAPRDGEPRSDCSEPPVGAAPVADIFHPGEGEMRQAGRAVPMIGSAVDAEDGDLTGDAMIWTTDREGEIGRGRTFDWTPVTLGAQTITLSARDSDGRTGTDSVTLTIIE
ncbi:MAG: hypothetical protein M3Y87_20690 [Myxococcota bacterium]|nr:hypothetical protein [Myxococcota bacterium]